MIIAGIDYSLSSPGICIYDDSKEFSFDNLEFLAIPGNKKLKESKYWNIRIIQNIGITDVSVSRFDFLSENVLEFLNEFDVERVFIEDYAFAAKGRVFNIGENCGILKYKLLRSGIHYGVISPPVIKKFATGKGNSNKDAMLEAFEAESGVDMYDVFDLKRTKSIPSPIDDLIDSFYICKYAASINN